MDKIERLTKTLAGERTDRPPVAVWRHWPGDDQRSADLARSTVEFQKQYDWDFVKVTPASSFCVSDYGLHDEWQGHHEGVRAIVRRVVTRSLDWTDVRPLDPTRGALARQVDALRLTCDGLKDDNVPILQTIFSPLAQAKFLAGNEMMLRHLRTQPDRLHTALNALTESTLRLIEALKKLSIAGIFYATQHASYDLLSEAEYQAFGLPYDRKILEAVPERWWFNLLHLHGNAPMFRLCSSLPVQAINWHDQEHEPDLAQAKLIYNGAVCGGVSATAHMHFGTPASVRDAVKSAQSAVNNRRLIVAPGCVAYVTTPLSNLRALRAAVESGGV